MIALSRGVTSSTWLLYHLRPGLVLPLGEIPGLVVLCDRLVNVKYRNKIIFILLVIPCAASLAYSYATNVTIAVFAFPC